jgi:predicted DNA-binding transcriptional regulator AlpA
MPKSDIPLTDELVRNLPAADPGERYEYWDSEVKGYAVRVNDTGTKSLVFVYRRPIHGVTSLVRRTLGSFPSMLIVEGRELARNLYVKYRQALLEGRERRVDMPKPEKIDLVEDDGRRIKQPDVAKLLGVTVRTIHRYRHDPGMHFPEPVEINGRQYFRRAEILNWQIMYSSANPSP